MAVVQHLGCHVVQGATTAAHHGIVTPGQSLHVHQTKVCHLNREGGREGGMEGGGEGERGEGGREGEREGGRVLDTVQ